MSKRSLLIPLLAVSLFSCADHRAGRLGEFRVISDVKFRSRVELQIGVTRSVDVAIADFNGDGVPDLAAADLGGHVAIQIGTAAGSFTDGGNFVVAGKPIAIIDADLDNDDDIDLLLVSADANVATAFLNDGDANFAASQQITVQELPTSAAVGDFTGDGVVDLLVTHLSRSDVLLLEGNGDGTFQPAQSISIPRGTRTSALTVADVNEDSIGDVLFCDTDNNRIVILFGSVGTEGFGIETVGVSSEPIALSVGDLDGDGVVEIAVSAFGDDTIDVVVHDKGYHVGWGIGVSGSPANSVIADVDGDGFNDLAVCVLNKTAISVFSRPTEGLSFGEYQLPSTGIPFRPLVANLAGDARPDLVVVSTELDRINVYPRSDEGLHCERTVRASATSSLVTEAVDLDGDGVAEIVTCGNVSTSLSVMEPTRNQSGPVLAEAYTTNLGEGATSLASGDFDGDGLTDLLVGLNSSVKLFANHSVPGSFDLQLVNAGPVLEGQVPAGLAIADVTGDGRPDLVISFLVDQKVVVVPGAGGFTFGTPVETEVADYPTGIAVADFDRDGLNEVVLTRAGSNQLAMFDVSATGALISPLQIPVGAGPLFLRVADFNLDGRPDLAVTCTGDDTVRILVGQAGGGFRSSQATVAEVPTALTVADLDLDGVPDLVVTTLRSTATMLLLGDGNGGVASTKRVPGVYAATAVVCVDVVGSDLPDLVIGSEEIDRVVVYQNDSVRTPVNL